MALWALDVAWEVPGASLRGRAEVLAHFSAYWEALPDMYLTIDREVEAGPFVATGARCTGTHQGTLRTPGGDIPPTGRRIDLTLGEINEVQGGLIVASRLWFDRLALLEQIGAASAPAPV